MQTEHSDATLRGEVHAYMMSPVPILVLESVRCCGPNLYFVIGKVHGSGAFGLGHSYFS